MPPLPVSLVPALVASGYLLASTAAVADQGAKAKPDRMHIVGSPENLDAVPGSAHVLDSSDLDRHSHGDVHRVLRQLPGVNIHEEEGFGLFPHIGIRGTRLERNARITVMEDGVLIAPAPYSAPAAYYFPAVARMSGLEVRKGSAAVRSGPYTTGGAVNLISTPIPEDRSAHASFMLGSYQSQRAHTWVGGTEGDFAWLLEANSASSQGFKQLDTNLRSDNSMPRPNTGFDRQSYMGKLRWNISQSPVYQDLQLKFAFDQLTAHETYLGLTAADYAANPMRRYSGSQLDEINTSHELFQLSHVIAPSSNLDIMTTIYRSNFVRNWYKLHGVQSAPGESYTSLTEILDNEDDHPLAMAWIRGEGGQDVLGNLRANNRKYYSQGIQTQVAYTIDTEPIRHELEFGLRYHEDEEDRLQWQDSYRAVNGNMVLVRPGQGLGAEDRIENGIPGNTDNRTTEAKATAMYVQNVMRMGDLTVIPGLRYEDITFTRKDYPRGDDPNRDMISNERSNSTQVLLPGLGLTYRISPDLLFLVGAHRGFAPTGSDESVPEEKSWNYETGLRFRNGGVFRADIVAFWTQYENLVGTCTASTGGGCEIGDQFDGGKVDVYGLEALANYDLGRVLEWSYGVPVRFAYTWTDSRFNESFDSNFPEWGNVESGDKLSQIPEHQLNLGLGLVANLWQVNLAVNYVSESRSVAGQGSISEDERIDGRTLVDLSAEYRVHDHGRLFANVENLTDERYTAARRPSGLRPGAPRIAWTGVKFDF